MQSQAELFEQIESKYGFTLPNEYKKLSQEGRFQFDGLPGTPFGGLLHSKYMWFHDMEWSTLPEILDPHFFNAAEPGFVRFAITGGNDSWCWYIPATDGQKTPIVKCPRDDRYAKFYAEDFISAVYRHALEFCTWEIDDETIARQYLARWSRDLGPYIPPRWQQTLKQLSVAPLKTLKSRDGGMPCLLDRKECDDLIKRDLAFDRLDEKIIWMED